MKFILEKRGEDRNKMKNLPKWNGNDLLSHALRQSTIGDEALNFRVRNGFKCYLFSIIATPFK